MSRRLIWLALAACGGSPGPRAPQAGAEADPDAIRLQPVVAEQIWYRATSTCGQGPYEIELAATGARWGEEVELLVHAPRAIALHADVVADGSQVANTTYGGKPDNARCVADARERLALAHAGGGGGGGGAPGQPVTPGTLVVPPPPASTTAQLQIETGVVTTSEEVVRFRVPDRSAPRIRIRFWSVEPNDLDGVLFGAAHVVWRPNVPDDKYEAYLAAVAAAERAQQERREAELRREQEERARRPQVTIKVDVEAELRAERARAEELRRRAAEEERRRQIRVALEQERRARRAAYCAAHPGDTECWGAGGLRVHVDLERREEQRAVYCAAHVDDARCWTPAERNRREVTWNRRVQAALAPACEPTTAPPAPAAETTPPKLSAHADWRPGYWQWTECTWVWLAGMWRVPDSDIVAEQTTSAPAAPPPLQVEAPPPAPVNVAVWIPGFWQWSGTTWVWIAGSWQLRPSANVTWRAAEWRARGAVHVLIPGGWIHVR